MATELDLNTADPEQLHRLFEEMQNGETVAAADPEPQSTPPEPAAQAKEEEQDKQNASEPSAQSEDQAAGVATKDGKHVIPYSVLKGERERASRAEQMLREMQEKLAKLESAAQAGSQGANEGGEGARTSADTSVIGDVAPEDLEALKEDFPTVYKSVMAAMAAVKAVEEKIKPVEQTVQEQQQERDRTVAEQVQDAIDSVPKLSHIQASNKDAFELAKQFDATLRTQGAWKDKPLAERFNKVIEMVESTIGPIELPKTQPEPEELKKAAQAKLAEVKATKAAVPTSLSEFPAGQAPEANESEQADNMTPLQLAAKFASMTPEQMDAYFQNL